MSCLSWSCVDGKDATTETNQANFTTDRICSLIDLDLDSRPTYFKYYEGFYSIDLQKHGFALGSPVSPTVANLYMEVVESIVNLYRNNT